MSWIGDIPDPLNFLEIYQSGSGNNHTHWSNAKFDQTVQEALKMSNGQARFNKLAEAELIILNEVPLIPVYNYVFYSLVNTGVQGFTPNLAGIYQFKDMRKGSD